MKRTSRRAYYNESAPYPGTWLRNLIGSGELPYGVVDHRSIADVDADSIGYGQAHFFAGIGGWPLALRMAGLPDDAPVWTGSCPCQPFSTMGAGKGFDDSRHLWPTWLELIRKCEPAIIFGEQVASALGREWFAFLRSDLEALGYAVGCADLCAAGVGAPHVRQRLYWVAYAGGQRRDRFNVLRARETKNPGFGVWDFSRGGRYLCSDENSRPVKPGLEPVAHGLSGFVGSTSAYGNAIVPQLAAEFVGAALEAL